MKISKAKILISVFFIFFAKNVQSHQTIVTQTQIEEKHLTNVTKVEDRLNLIFCWSHNVHTALSCSDLQKISKKIVCIKETDGISCLKLLQNNKADFMIAEPEELIVAGMDESENEKLVVTHELVDSSIRSSSSSTKLRMVVVADKEIKNLVSPQKKILCSSGLDSKNYMQYFEKIVLNPNCENNKTFLENRIYSWSEKFQSNCIANAKNYDEKVYKKIMAKYPNLHSGCSKLPNSTPLSEKEAVKCLFENNGNVLWSKLTDVHGYFKYELDFFRASTNFHFICPDGTTRNLTDSYPCVWFMVPVYNIIARKKIGEQVHKVLPLVHHQMFSIKLTNASPPIKKGGNIYDVSPNEYLNNHFDQFFNFHDLTICKQKKTINWCITTEIEARKCHALYKAARVYGIEPLIHCVVQPTPEMCMESVKKTTSEIFVVNINDTFQAKKKGLKPIARLFSRDEAIYNQTVAMITEKMFLSFNSLKDLENKTACFTSYRGPGWNAFIHLMGELTNNSDWYCDDKKMVSSFFKEVCVVGLSEQNSTFPTNLYSFCPRLLINDTTDAENTAWSCLDYGAHVAFVTYKNESESGKLPLCINGDWKDSLFSPEECVLTQSAQASLMINKGTPEVREDEIRLLINDLQRLFGTPYLRYNIFSLFGHFEGTTGVMFPENTVRMELFQSSNSRKVSPEAVLDEINTKREFCNYLNSVYDTTT